MACIRDKNVVDIPTLAKTIPPNPLLGYAGSGTAPASAASGSSKGSSTQSTLRHRVLLYDQRCFVTGAVSNQLEACHLINAIRMDKSNRTTKKPLKDQVEHILTRQQFGPKDFALDSLPNCISLEAQWHGDLDTHGSFCITVPLDQTLKIAEELGARNRDWERRANSDPNAKRNLEITKVPFVVDKCVLLVLRPELFLPEGRPILINTNRKLRVPGGAVLSATDSPSWTQYLSPQGPYLIDTFDQEFKQFDFVSMRRQDQKLSVFSLLVNANSKLQAAKKRNNRPVGIDLYISLVAQAIEAIFFVPRPIQEGTLSLIPPVPPIPSEHRSGVTSPGSSIKSRRSSRKAKEQDPSVVGRKDGGAVEEELPQSDADLERSDHCSEEGDGDDEEGDKEDYDEDDEYDDEEDEDPDMINGLTFPEMEIVIRRASDGTISAAERTEAALLMLGMAGGNKRPQAVSPLLQDYM